MVYNLIFILLDAFKTLIFSVDSQVKKVGGLVAKKAAAGVAGALLSEVVDAAMESLV